MHETSNNLPLMQTRRVAAQGGGCCERTFFDGLKESDASDTRHAVIGEYVANEYLPAPISKKGRYVIDDRPCRFGSGN